MVFKLDTILDLPHCSSSWVIFLESWFNEYVIVWLIRDDRLLISIRNSFFFGSAFKKNSQVKRAWLGVILRWVTDREAGPDAHKWGQCARERLVLIRGASLDPARSNDHRRVCRGRYKSVLEPTPAVTWMFASQVRGHVVHDVYDTSWHMPWHICRTAHTDVCAKRKHSCARRGCRFLWVRVYVIAWLIKNDRLLISIRNSFFPRTHLKKSSQIKHAWLRVILGWVTDQKIDSDARG